MAVELVDHQEYVVLELRAGPVNAMNPVFFGDLKEALSCASERYPERPLVITGSGNCFSAGLDLGYTAPLIANGSHAEIRNWFWDFRDALNTVLFYPWPTIAAVNGHAVAAGLLLALCCDRRVICDGTWSIGLNEVQVGIPMPSSYMELLRIRLDPDTAFELACFGGFIPIKEALRMRVFHRSCKVEELFEAVEVETKRVPREVMVAYAHSKRMYMAPFKERIERISSFEDETTYTVAKTDALGKARENAMTRIKRQSP